jgi:hypothetical protein
VSQHYCDSKRLENNWFHWLLSSATPDLERFRHSGILWTKVLGEVTENGVVIKSNGCSFPNPCHPNRAHCLALPVPLFFNSFNNIPQPTCTATVAGKATTIKLSDVEKELNLLSDHWMYTGADPLAAIQHVIPSLRKRGYILERPTNDMWHAMLTSIEQMCLGIATKFNLPCEEERVELAHEALLQVTKKLVARKLVYTPGKAPVFNLLTTTIFRCMYSIKNRSKRQREGMHKLFENMQAGILPDNFRSFRRQYQGRLIRAQ